MSSRGAEPHDHEPARQPTLAAYAPEPVLPPAASAPDWRSRQGRWVDRSLSGRHHLPCCRGLFRPVAKSNPCTIPRSKRQRPSYRSRPHTPNLWTVPRQVLYLGEINDSQRAAWSRAIEVFDEGGQSTQIALFPEDRVAPVLDCDVVSIRLSQMRLRRPRQWGACWLAMVLWDQLRLDDFWGPALPPSREGTDWLNVLKTLVAYQLISPGSEWRLHRHWFEHCAMGDLLGEDIALVQPNNLYRCLDLLVAHKPALFRFLRERWKNLFQADFGVLVYDLTSTYFECDPPEERKRKFGYSRDKRSDCVQVVIALIVTPDGFPLAYEVMAGNTSDKTTLRAFLAKIEAQYGSAKRTWVMDRGIPTEEVLAEMRASQTPIHYLVGTPRGRLTKLEKALAAKPWEDVRESVRVKLIEQEQETYVFARSQARREKEQAMRRRRLRKLIKRLRELQGQNLTRDELLL